MIKVLFWSALLLACCVIILMYVLDNGVPEPIVKKICDKLSSEDIIVKIDRITFNTGDGLHLHDISAEPRKLASESFGSIDDLIIDASLSPFIDHHSRVKKITLKGVEMPRHPRVILRKLRKMKADAGELEPDKPRQRLPTLDPFRLAIENSNVIGLDIAQTTAWVTIGEPTLKFSYINLKWPDTTYNTRLKGGLEVDLNTELLAGDAKGMLFPENLRAFLKELEANSVIREINRFSDIETPIHAASEFNVDLDSGDFAIAIDLDLKECAYREVPLFFAKGFLQAAATNDLTWVKISKLATANESGRVEGNLFYDEKSSSVEFQANSTMDHNQVFAIIDILTHGELHPLKPIRPPSITAKGVAAVSTNSPTRHNLSGEIAMGEGEVFALRIKQAASNYRVVGDHAHLDDIKASTPSGGDVSGDAKFTIFSETDQPPSIRANVKFNQIDLSDLARIFSVTNTTVGKCSGDMLLSGVLGTNQLHTLNGEGHFKIKKGHLNRMPLFAGLTDYMTRNIPGVSSIVDQSDCSFDFTIKDGLLRSKNFMIEGDVFSIQGKGTYDVPNDELKFTVHVALFRKKTLVGRITRAITFPFQKLLLEFKVFGSVDNPDWSYVNIIEKITDQIPDRK